MAHPTSRVERRRLVLPRQPPFPFRALKPTMRTLLNADIDDAEGRRSCEGMYVARQVRTRVATAVKSPAAVARCHCALMECLPQRRAAHSSRDIQRSRPIKRRSLSRQPEGAAFFRWLTARTAALMLIAGNIPKPRALKQAVFGRSSSCPFLAAAPAAICAPAAAAFFFRSHECVGSVVSFPCRLGALLRRRNGTWRRLLCQVSRVVLDFVVVR